MPLTETITNVTFTNKLNTNVDPEIDDTDNGDFDGWYCIKTDPWLCPFCLDKGVKFEVHFATIDHKIIVFPEKDDPNLLKLARWAQGDNRAGINRNPKIVEYERPFGPCISWYAFEYITHS